MSEARVRGARLGLGRADENSCSETQKIIDETAFWHSDFTPKRAAPCEHAGNDAGKYDGDIQPSPRFPCATASHDPPPMVGCEGGAFGAHLYRIRSHLDSAGAGAGSGAQAGASSRTEASADDRRRAAEDIRGAWAGQPPSCVGWGEDEGARARPRPGGGAESAGPRCRV